MIVLSLLLLGSLPNVPAPRLAPPTRPHLSNVAGPEADDRALYVEHCAKCHGESGDGKGTTELDRPARSFLLGGYSYGNTQAAVRRSVVHGIPGTPMPAFGATLKEDELAAVAAYVIALGPPGTIVEPGASVLTVGERPLIVHGMMPAIGEGSRPEPRSLVVGFPNGTTFQYRMKDAHLVAIRQGNFLDRQDWGGRGGAPLKPLGAVTWTGTTDFDPSFVSGESEVSRRITGASVRGQQVWVDFDLVDPKNVKIGGGQEILSFLMVEGAPVAVRSVLGVSGVEDVTLAPPPVAQHGFNADFDVDAAQATIADWASLPEGDLLFVQPGMRQDLRIYVHAKEWTPALKSAVIESLAKKN